MIDTNQNQSLILSTDWVAFSDAPAVFGTDTIIPVISDDPTTEGGSGGNYWFTPNTIGIQSMIDTFTELLKISQDEPSTIRLMAVRVPAGLSHDDITEYVDYGCWGQDWSRIGYGYAQYIPEVEGAFIPNHIGNRVDADTSYEEFMDMIAPMLAMVLYSGQVRGLFSNPSREDSSLI